MKKYIFMLKDDQLNIALIRTIGPKTKVISSTSLNDANLSKLFESYAMVQMEQLNKPISDFIKSTRSRARVCEFVLGLDSIISRTIEIPHLGKKDLASYMSHNMSTFFTVDMDDYFFDYKIVKVIPKTKDDPKKLRLKVVVVPKAILVGINKLTKDMGLKLGEVSIYPDIMQRLVQRGEDLGVLDVSANRRIYTIYADDTTFIYTSIDTQTDAFEDFTDEVEYFTDFYASRYEGQHLKNLYMIGKEQNDDLIAYMNERLVTSVQPINYTNFKQRASSHDMIHYPGTILSLFKVKEIRGETIDFSEEEALKEKIERSFEPGHLFLVLSIVTVGWFLDYNYYLEGQIDLYQGNLPDTSEYTSLQTEVQALTKERDGLLKYQRAVEEIEGELFNYKADVDMIHETIPGDVFVQNMVITKDTVKLTLSNIPTSLDLIESIIAINGTGYYEEIQLSDISLADDIGEYELLLNKVTVQEVVPDE